MLRDIRSSVRLFQRSPGFSATVILTLALGMGLTTAIFSVVDGVLLRPLPYSHPTALVTGPTVSSEAWIEWRHRTAAFDGIALYDFSVAPLLFSGAETARVRQAAVSSNFLSVLGVRPVAGRDFEPADNEPGAESVVMLTYQAWQQHFGGQANVVGRMAPFDPAPRRVIGVLPADFVFPMRLFASAGAVRMLTPIAMPSQPGYTFGVLARLKKGASLTQARAENLAMVPRPTGGSAVPSTSKMTVLSEDMLGGSRRALLLLFGAVGFLLLIACANAGNLLFAKGAEARREFSVRFALGASRGQLARMVIVQSCGLSITGGLLGILLAYWSFDGLMSFVPPQLPRADNIGIDSRVLGFAFLLSLVSGAMLGLFPAWHLSRGELHSTLQAYERATLPAQRLRLAVLATEVALAVVLLSGAMLFARSFVRLLRVDLGFASRDVLTMHVRTLQSRYPTVDQQRAFLGEALNRIATLPGVMSAAAVELLPVTRARRGGSVVTVDGPVAEPIEAEPRVVSSGYFETMSVRLVLGRFFNRNDSSGSPRVAIINQALARRLWPGLNPIGRRIRYEKEELGEVVGVVGDVRGYSVDTRPEPQVYVPYLQTWLVPQRLVIRTAGNPETFAAAIRHEIRAIDSRASTENVQPLSAHVAASVAQPRFLAWLLGIFGGSGLLLSVIGIGGVVAYGVSRRRREIGIRIALGARARDVVWTVMAPSLAAVGIGLSVGTVAAGALGGVARAFLFEIEPHDPLTLSAVVVVLGGTALAAGWLPALRAQRIDPLVALRAE